ncbi:hypothetical protein EDC01DRAFT_93480 [Geopyxis carbonaria]|nr:hypothetical protein EDC01DRAFT_93480 [Geopyxis carbonaria]
MGTISPTPASALALHWSLIGISGIFVAVRLWIRRSILARSLEASDYFIVLTFLIWLATIGMNTFFLANNNKYNQTLDINIILENEALIVEILKMSLALTMLYYTMLLLIKAAFLAIYFRLVEQLSILTKVVLWMVTGFIVCGWIACELIQLLWCQPISRQWTTDFLDYCTPFYSVQAFTYAYAYNVASDILVILFPILIWRQLKLKRTEKTGLLFIFFVGIISVAASTARFIIVKASTDNLADQQTSGTIVSMMSSVEVSAGLIAACLPTFRALLSFQKTANARSAREESERRSQRNRKKGHSSTLDSTLYGDDIELRAADQFPPSSHV